MRVVIITSTSLELLIALLLLPRFVVLEETFGEAAWHGIFYGISAFNNAGFIPTEHGLAPYVGDWMLCLPIILGVFIGSLGFPVILNVMRNRRRASKWSLHTKLTLTTSAALVVVGTVLFAAVEWGTSGPSGPSGSARSSSRRSSRASCRAPEASRPWTPAACTRRAGSSPTR